VTDGQEIPGRDVFLTPAEQLPLLPPDVSLGEQVAQLLSLALRASRIPWREVALAGRFEESVFLVHIQTVSWRLPGCAARLDAARRER
jgi:hypothetical protein